MEAIRENPTFRVLGFRVQGTPYDRPSILIGSIIQGLGILIGGIIQGLGILIGGIIQGSGQLGFSTV